MTIRYLTHTHLSDQELLVEVASLAAAERTATARLVAALAEVDARRLYLGQGYSSLFVYCTRALRLSEHAAYSRIEAARASRRFPALLERLADGDLTLTALCLLAPHLTQANQREVLDRARHRSKREIEEIVASLRPRPDVPARLRKLPGRPVARVMEPSSENLSTTSRPSAVHGTLVASAPSPPSPAVVQALASERYKLQLTIGRAMQEKLHRARDLLRHACRRATWRRSWIARSIGCWPISTARSWPRRVGLVCGEPARLARATSRRPCAAPCGGATGGAARSRGRRARAARGRSWSFIT
jgi:hypothetical protein